MDLLALIFVAICMVASCDEAADAGLRNEAIPILSDRPSAAAQSPPVATIVAPAKGRKVSDSELGSFLQSLFVNDLSAPSRLGYNISADPNNKTSVPDGLSGGKLKQAIREAVQNSSRVYDNDDYTMLRSLLRFPTYRTFNDLLDNYDPQLGRAEVESSQEKAEIDRFVDAIFATHVANLTFQFVQNTGKFNSRSQFQDYVKQTWFGGFRRGGSSPTVLDSSAFEHVFLGERNSEKMTSGLHSWIQYLLQERAGYMHYCGWHDNTPSVLSFAFIWREFPKYKTSIFLNTSPEVEIFAYTACFINRPGGVCSVLMNTGVRVQIKAELLDRNDKTSELSSAYPVIPGKSKSARSRRV